MRIAALVHFATPWRNAGSETVLHLFLRALVAEGHEVRCIVTDCGNKPPLVYETVPLETVRNVTVGIAKLRTWKPDVVISHHQNSALVTRYAKHWESKSVYLTHNDMDVNRIPLKFEPDLVIHNAEWVKESLNSRFDIPGKQIVVHPPLDCERHSVPRTGDHVTLININEHKGGKIFSRLARQMPDIQFQAVLGGHGVQVRPPRLPNITLVKHNPDLSAVWSKTGLLLMPSIYESYGLVGIEAGCSGIPTLANDTPGLRESLGESGHFITKRENLAEWQHGIRTLLEPKTRKAASELALDNSKAKCEQTIEGLSRMVSAIEDLARD